MKDTRKDWDIRGEVLFEEELERRIRRLEEPGYRGLPPMRKKDYWIMGGMALVSLAVLIAGVWLD